MKPKELFAVVAVVPSKQQPLHPFDKLLEGLWRSLPSYLGSWSGPEARACFHLAVAVVAAVVVEGEHAEMRLVPYRVAHKRSSWGRPAWEEFAIAQPRLHACWLNRLGNPFLLLCYGSYSWYLAI